MENTTLGIPALIQSEGLHGFTNNGTIFPSPGGLAASFNRALVQSVAASISNEAEGLGIQHIFAPVLDLGREQRWGRIEENYGGLWPLNPRTRRSANSQSYDRGSIFVRIPFGIVWCVY